jgi:ATP-dependent DNA ligase
VDRRRTLEDIIDGREFLYVARRLADDGLKAWQQVQERGYEGLVAKDQRSLYDPPADPLAQGKVRHEGRFVIGGVIQRDDLNALPATKPSRTTPLHTVRRQSQV